MKKIFILVFLMISAVVTAQLDTINIGTSANSGTGEGLRSAFLKTNNAIDKLNLQEVDSIIRSGDDVQFYEAGDTLIPYIPPAGYDNMADYVPLLADTIPLVTFGAGSGLTADTALFNNNVLIGSFYNEGSDTLVVTQMVGILKEGTGTETIDVQISWHATFLSGSATSLNAAALSITSLTTGTVDTSFANAKIPPNVFVWGIFSGASANNKPTFLSITLSGYKIPSY